MDRNTLIVIALVLVLVVGVLAFPRVSTAYARDRALTRCAELRAQRASQALAGASAITLAQLDAQVRECSQEAASLGADVDLGLVDLANCRPKMDAMNQQMTHYRNTDYSDTLKRQNTRNYVISVGEELVRCFQQALAESEKLSTVEEIRGAIAQAIQENELHERGFRDQASGYGRFLGSTDTFPPEIADAFLTRIVRPLRDLHVQATRRRDELQAAAVAAARTPAYNVAAATALARGGAINFLP